MPGTRRREMNSYAPTIARVVPTRFTLAQLLGYERFPKRSKAHLRQTKQPNALPASWRCPGQPKVSWEVLSLSTPGSLSVMAATVPAMFPFVYMTSTSAANSFTGRLGPEFRFADQFRIHDFAEVAADDAAGPPGFDGGFHRHPQDRRVLVAADGQLGVDVPDQPGGRQRGRSRQTRGG
jgi:hypothetical protein